MTGVPILVPGVESLLVGLVPSSALVVVGVLTGYTGEDGLFKSTPVGFLALVIVVQVWRYAVVWKEKGCL